MMDPAQELEAQVLAQQRPMLEAMAVGQSEIQRFYHDSVVFLTGGSGFLGKQLMEKLLRCCGVSKVYTLLRPKKGQQIEERLKTIIEDPVFGLLREQQPDFFSKVIAVEGDVAELKLGIKDHIWKTLTKEVDVIFHVAATTRFDEPLYSATLINVRGTREAMLLGKECKKLKSFVHVSTAYTHATADLANSQVEEKFYPAPLQADILLSMAENMDSNRLNNITTELIEGWPNTYSFTKAVAEDLIRTKSSGLPICIVRPGIVTGTYREPTPGWLDKSCLFGVSGMIFGGGLGVIHIFFVDKKVVGGFIPCDYVNNAAIAAAKETATDNSNGGDSTKIYTVTCAHRNPVTFGRFFADIIQYKAVNFVSPKTIYYVWLMFTTNKYMFALLSTIFHIIPGYIADFVCLLLGKKRRFAKLTKVMYKMCTIVGIYATSQWDFVDNNLEKLYQKQTKQDQAIFNFDIVDIDWVEYILAICIGIRKYVLKDNLQGTAEGLKNQKYYKILHYIITPLYFYLLFKILSSLFTIGFSIISLALTCIAYPISVLSALV